MIKKKSEKQIEEKKTSYIWKTKIKMAANFLFERTQMIRKWDDSFNL